MSDLSKIDKLKLEKCFEMNSGYVLDFGNNTFQNFVLESTGLDIDERKYSENNSGSKANRLRAFWKFEDNYNVSKLILDLLEYKATKMNLNSAHWSIEENSLISQCHDIAVKLKGASLGMHVESIKPRFDSKEFNLIYSDIKNSIEKGTPETAIDRLHTYFIKYIRKLCEDLSLPSNKDKPLHSLMGEFIKTLKDKGKIETEMTERILKSSISILDSFNSVRNNKSLAHDNIFLNKEESNFILKVTMSIIEFLNGILSEKQNNNNIDDLPF